ncbi:UNVERIFIED_CONTAM: putative deacylase [Brevibacillus sp. OAP136]
MREVRFEQDLTRFTVYEYGNKQGPRVAITAAIHGDEQTAIHTANLLMKALGDLTVNGYVKVIPVCNPPSFRNRTRFSPFDHIDMNRIFPGSPDGGPTHQLAHALWQETRDVDYIVDLHCVGNGGATYTLALYKEFPELRELAEALALPIIIQSSGTRGQLFVESCHAGQKALIIELPAGQPGGTIDVAAAEECSRAVIRYLHHLGVLSASVPGQPVTFYDEITTVVAQEPGLFLPALEPGIICERGTALGTWNDTPLLAPFTGVITTISPPRYCFTGESLAGIAPIAGAQSS